MAACEQAPRQYILSLRPQWMELVTSGIKTVDVRRTAPALPAGKKATVWLYETKAGGGRGKIVARCTVDGIRQCNVFRRQEQAESWARLTCLSVEALEDYQRGRKYLRFWLLDDVELLDKAPTLKQLGVTCPPQSWCTVKRVCEIDG